MSETWVYRVMLSLASFYGSAILSQLARFLLPLLPDKFAIALLVIAGLAGAIALGVALYQGRDRALCYGILAGVVIGLTIGGVA